MTAGNKSQYIADVKVMNYLLQAIPNDIYNSVDACKMPRKCENELKAKEGESLESVYERLTTLLNIMDRNHVRLIPVSINTKFLNCLQPEWSKYVTMEDKLTTAMMLLARAITQKFSTPTNNCLRTSSNTLNQAVIQDGRVDIQTKNAGYGGNGNRNARRNRSQGFNTGNAGDESNQIIQPVPRTESTPEKANVQCYNEKGHYARECRKPKVRDVKYFREQMLLAAKYSVNKLSHVKCKNIIQTFDDDQIDSNIIFDDPYVENNGGTSEHDSNAHDEYHEIQMLAYNIHGEELEHELRDDKDTIERILKEKDKIQSDFFKIENEKLLIQNETQLAKKAFKERENRYLEDIVDLEEKLSYKNLEGLKKAIAAQPKMYDGERLHSAKLTIDSPDSGGNL
ncbi:hypothetical protein Tco_1284214 [Tanacetum coccineum]